MLKPYLLIRRGNSWPRTGQVACICSKAESGWQDISPEIFLKKKKINEMNGLKLLKPEQIFFEDVKVGTEIPPLVKTPYNLGKMARGAAAHADFYAGRFDYKTANDRFKVGRPFAYELQLATYLSRPMTNWIGPNGMLKKFKSRTVNNIFDKDIVTCRGIVVRKYMVDQEGYLDCEVLAEVQNGTVVAKGTATVILPHKGGVAI